MNVQVGENVVGQTDFEPLIHACVNDNAAHELDCVKRLSGWIQEQVVRYYNGDPDFDFLIASRNALLKHELILPTEQ